MKMGLPSLWTRSQVSYRTKTKIRTKIELKEGAPYRSPFARLSDFFFRPIPHGDLVSFKSHPLPPPPSTQTFLNFTLRNLKMMVQFCCKLLPQCTWIRVVRNGLQVLEFSFPRCDKGTDRTIFTKKLKNLRETSPFKRPFSSFHLASYVWVWSPSISLCMIHTFSRFSVQWKPVQRTPRKRTALLTTAFTTPRLDYTNSAFTHSHKRTFRFFFCF